MNESDLARWSRPIRTCLLLGLSRKAIQFLLDSSEYRKVNGCFLLLRWRCAASSANRRRDRQEEKRIVTVFAWLRFHSLSLMKMRKYCGVFLFSRVEQMDNCQRYRLSTMPAGRGQEAFAPETFGSRSARQRPVVSGVAQSRRGFLMTSSNCDFHGHDRWLGVSLLLSAGRRPTSGCCLATSNDSPGSMPR